MYPDPDQDPKTLPYTTQATKMENLDFCSFDLKVLTNEERGCFKEAAFGRSPFKLFTLRFSNKSVQAPSSERPKTTRPTLFLSREINNFSQITA
jgi:hypothetical protein